MPRMKFRRTLIAIAIVCLILGLTEICQFWASKYRDEQIILATRNVMNAMGTRNTTAYVLPDQPTTILEPTLKDCKNSGSDIFALFMVISSPENRERRDVIRYTLGTHMDRMASATIKDTDQKVKTLFFVGVSSKASQKEVKDEAEIYGHLVIDNLTESYVNLTLKTLRMLKWTQGNCKSARFLIKIDDDVHLNAGNFLNYLQNIPEKESRLLVAGHKYNQVSIDKDPYSKWFTPTVLWPEEKLPEFVAGFCYVLGREAAGKIYEGSFRVPLFHLEDVYLTGMVAGKSLNMKVTHIPGILTYWLSVYNLYTTSCNFLKYMVVHSVGPAHLTCWDSFNMPQFVCGSTPLFLIC